jgi:hypothetical protein
MFFLLSRFNASAYAGELISPPLATFLTSKYGYERATSILGLYLITFGILYFPV